MKKLAAIGCLGLLGLSVWWLTHTPSWMDGAGWVVLMVSAWVLFAAGLWLILHLPRRFATALIVLAGIGLPLAAGFAPPRSSDDLYRYIWDGRVQAAGFDPYLHAPASDELRPLRDDFLWPPHRTNWCVPSDACTLINRPTVNTIYPPAAQAYFVTVHWLSPPGAGERPIQLAATFFAAAMTVLLVLALPRLGLDPRLAAAWAWCPFVALETGNNAHVDVVAAFLGAVALVAAARKRGVLSGVFLGLAVATKLTPALLGPSLLRRKPLAVALGAVAAIAAVYLPHVLAVGPKVIGYLPTYLDDEGYTSGGRFSLLTLVVPAGAATVAVAAILAGVAFAVWWRADPDRPWAGATVLVGVTLLLATPGYSWYALLLVMLVAFSGRLEYLTVVVAGYLAQYAGFEAQRYGYGTAAIVIAATALWRNRSSLRRTAPAP